MTERRELVLKNLVRVRRHSKVSCPDCQVVMTPFQCREAIVDRCSSCLGIWFDRSELGTFRDSLNDLNLAEVQVLHDPEPAAEVLSGCPVCGVLLEESRYGYNSKVVLKMCRRCEGIWLPHANLLRFIDMVKLVQAVAPEIKGIAQESKKFFQERKHDEHLREVGELARRPVPWRYWFGWRTILPLRDENPRERFHLITVGLLFLNLLIFSFTYLRPEPLRL